MQYFEQNPAVIHKVLESFVTFVHSDHVKVRLRSWYLSRFVRVLRNQLGDVAQTIIQAIVVCSRSRAELPEDREEDDMSSDENDQSANAVFEAQLYLFEAVVLLPLPTLFPAENKVQVASYVINPLVADISNSVVCCKGRR